MLHSLGGIAFTAFYKLFLPWTAVCPIFSILGLTDLKRGEYGKLEQTGICYLKISFQKLWVEKCLPFSVENTFIVMIKQKNTNKEYYIHIYI